MKTTFLIALCLTLSCSALVGDVDGGATGGGNGGGAQTGGGAGGGGVSDSGSGGGAGSLDSGAGGGAADSGAGGGNADSGSGGGVADGGANPGSADSGSTGGQRDGGTSDSGVSDAGAGAGGWYAPRSLVDDLGRLALGNQVHIVGHLNGQLVQRRSADNGLTWTSPDIISPATGNFPAMYGGLFSQGDSVYLITAVEDMASSAGAGGMPLEFRRSDDNGATWTSPVTITPVGRTIFRARIVASGQFVHVAGASDPTGDASFWYFRSTDNGATWAATALALNLGKYGGGQTVAVDGATVHVAYTDATGTVGAGPTLYRRSTDNGATWGTPVNIGEVSSVSSKQGRVQLTASGGKVFAGWQRESNVFGSAVPADRIGFNRSLDDGQTWGTAQVLPQNTGIDRNHEHVFMGPSGAVHFIWRHGDSGDSTPDPAGYMFSTDYGTTWQTSTFAIDTTSVGDTNHPWNIVANGQAVHVLTGPSGAMLYSGRRLP